MKNVDGIAVSRDRESERVIIATRGEIEAAFEAWLRDYEADPESYSDGYGEPESYGEGATATLVRYLDAGSDA